MKFPVIACILTLAACGTSHHGSTQGATLDTKYSNLDDIVTLCPDASIACYPAGAPARRNDLYECSSVAASGNSIHAFVEIFNDNSRRYYVTLKLEGGNISDTFVAEENASDAAPFYPIPYGAGTAQSSRVLHGMTEATRTALGYSQDANFLIELKGSVQSPVSMSVTEFGDLNPLTPTSLGLDVASCTRVGN